MKTGKNFPHKFFVKEPKFSVLIVLLAIIMLIVFFLTLDTSSFVPFSGYLIKMEIPSWDVPFRQVFSSF